MSVPVENKQCAVLESPKHFGQRAIRDVMKRRFATRRPSQFYTATVCPHDDLSRLFTVDELWHTCAAVASLSRFLVIRCLSVERLSARVAFLSGNARWSGASWWNVLELLQLMVDTL